MSYYKKDINYTYRFKKKDYKDNELIYWRKYNQITMIEIRLWKDIYEIYYRPKTKIYGYCLNRVQDLETAISIAKNINDNYLKSFFEKIDESLFP